jgi:serine/threonine-protein kinase SRPK3
VELHTCIAAGLSMEVNEVFLKAILVDIVFSDLHIGNVLLRIPGIEQISYQDLQKYLGEPYKRPLLSRDGLPVPSTPHKPKYVVASPEPLELLQLCLRSPEAIGVKICDFGESFLWDVEPVVTRLNTPCIYAAPEIIFHDRVSPAVDVWALAVLIHMVLSRGSLLFCSYYGIKQEVSREMVLTLGKFPDRWWTRWEDRSQYFDEDGTFIGDRTKLPPASGKFLKIPPDRMEAKELEELERVIRMMVSYEVMDRISAAEVVRLMQESWMTSSHKGIVY